MKLRFAGRRTIAIFVLSLTAVLCRAHEIRPAIIDLTFQPDKHYELAIRLNLEAMIAEIGPEHSDTNESVNAMAYDTLRKQTPVALKREFQIFAPRMLDGISVFDSAGRRLYHVVQTLEIPEVGDTELARDSTLVLRSTEPVTGESIAWSWDSRFGANIIRVSEDGQDDGYSAYLKNGDRSEPIPVGGGLKQTPVATVVNYVSIGFAHIVPKGLDHILFVVGLFLLSAKLAPLLWQITSFTIAHTVTLALGVTGLIQLSPAIVEPLIAASIVYVCIENIMSEKLQRWRPLVVFAFGLLHGLGFAGVLSEIGISATHFVTALVAFNVGVELGQISVILGCFLVAGFWFRHKPWYRTRITIPASGAIAVVGAYWFVERVFLG